MMSNVKHHDKVTFFKLFVFTFLSKKIFYWTYVTLKDWWAFNYNSSNSLKCNNWWCWDSSKRSFIIMAVCKVITSSSMGKSDSTHRLNEKVNTLWQFCMCYCKPTQHGGSWNPNHKYSHQPPPLLPTWNTMSHWSFLIGHWCLAYT
jgi:hypothetical protein